MKKIKLIFRNIHAITHFLDAIFRVRTLIVASLGVLIVVVVICRNCTSLSRWVCCSMYCVVSIFVANIHRHTHTTRTHYTFLDFVTLLCDKCLLHSAFGRFWSVCIAYRTLTAPSTILSFAVVQTVCDVSRRVFAIDVSGLFHSMMCHCVFGSLCLVRLGSCVAEREYARVRDSVCFLLLFSFFIRMYRCTNLHVEFIYFISYFIIMYMNFKYCHIRLHRCCVYTMYSVHLQFPSQTIEWCGEHVQFMLLLLMLPLPLLLLLRTETKVLQFRV